MCTSQHFHSSLSNMNATFEECTIISNQKSLVVQLAWVRHGWIKLDRKLCQILRLNFTSLSYLYWQAATEATLLNTHAPILVRASWQEHVWKWPKAVSAPYPPWRVRRFDNLKAWTHRIPFEMLLFEATKRWGSVGWPQGKWRRNRKGMLVFSNTSC